MEDRGDGSARDSLVARALASEWIPCGLFFVIVGAAALWLSRDYAVGTLNRMGPGYFPRMLSLGMIALGVLIAGRGIRDLAGASGLRININRSVLLIPLAMVAFSLSVERIGLVAALALALGIAALADRQSRPLEVGLWIVGLIALLVLIFVVVLKLPLRLWPEF